MNHLSSYSSCLYSSASLDDHPSNFMFGDTAISTTSDSAALSTTRDLLSGYSSSSKSQIHQEDEENGQVASADNDQLNTIDGLLSDVNTFSAVSSSNSMSPVYHRKRKVEEIDSNKDKFLKLKKRFDDAKKIIQNQSIEKSQLAEKNAYLEKRNKDIESEINRQNTYTDFLKLKNIVLKACYDQIKLDDEQTQKINNELQTRVHSLTNELEKAKSDVDKLEKQVTQYSKKNSEMQTETAILNCSIEQLKQALKSEKVNRDMQTQINELTSQWQKAKYDNERFQQEVESLKNVNSASLQSPPKCQRESSYSQVMQYSQSYGQNNCISERSYSIPTSYSSPSSYSVPSQGVPQDLPGQGLYSTPFTAPWRSPDSSASTAALILRDANEHASNHQSNQQNSSQTVFSSYQEGMRGSCSSQIGPSGGK